MFLLRVFNLLENGGEVLLEIAAHESALAALKFSPKADLIASASQKGTVIRVSRYVRFSCIKVRTVRYVFVVSRYVRYSSIEVCTVRCMYGIGVSRYVR